MTDTTPANSASEVSPWKSFWDRGGFWRAVALAVGYLVLYLAAGRLIGSLFDDQIDDDNVLSSASSVFWGVTAAILVGIVILLVFGASIRWLKELFGPQPIRGSWWMWILPVIILVTNLARFGAADYSQFTTPTVIMILIAGLAVGFAEELIARGFVVNLLRRHGYREIWVAVLSSLVFAMMHGVNIFGGQKASTVGLTMVYTFFFGIGMYFTLRVTGSIIWPMILHAMTDPSGMLLSGGLDKATDTTALKGSGLEALGYAAVPLTILAGLILVWFIRGKVQAIEPTLAGRSVVS